MGENSLSGYGHVISVNRPVWTRMQDVVGAGAPGYPIDVSYWIGFYVKLIEKTLPICIIHSDAVMLTAEPALD